MEKIRIGSVLVVEGRYDAAHLADWVDGLILTTDGFSVFTDREKQQLIRQLGARRGLLVLTDSDTAGFRIRRFLNDIAQGLPVKNVYIPALPGTERRKRRPGKEGLLGVEGVDVALLRSLLQAADAAPPAARCGDAITYADLFALGISGTAGAAARRAALLHSIGLPLHLSKRALLQVLNSLYTLQELTALCAAGPDAPAPAADP